MDWKSYLIKIIKYKKKKEINYMDEVRNTLLDIKKQQVDLLRDVEAKRNSEKDVKTKSNLRKICASVEYSLIELESAIKQTGG